MNKTITAVLAAFCALSLTACTGGDSPAPKSEAEYTEISAQVGSVGSSVQEESETQSQTEAQTEAVLCADITNAVISSVELPSMAEVGADRIAMYLDLAIPEGCDFSMYICGSGGFADEVFVINSDGMSLDDIKAAAEKRIDARKKDFEGYNPDEYEKLDNYFSAEKSGYYIYSVTCDNSVCERIFDEYVK